VRAGANYESSAIPTSWQGSSIVDGNKFGFGLGGTVNIVKRVALDASFGEQFLPAREITDSEVQQVVVAAGLTDPYPTTVGAGKVIGNGALKSHVTYAGVGATVFFGASDK
jgi:long-subunit fatty acid transport protein